MQRIGRFFMRGAQQKQALPTLYNAGKSLAAEGKLLEARDKFEEVLKADPSCEGARYRLIELMDQIENTAAPEALFANNGSTS